MRKDLVVFRCKGCIEDLKEYNPYVDAEGNELEGHNAGCALLVGIVIVFSFIFGGFASVLSLFSSH